ncbi:MAG: hypothetical protein KF878_01195 [Planctomycetes bacterium]|nr:hypothetical protein [Planctomycetota bacterium]MCW8139146.1 hypothetical protein [Planctomycetota bacterium]
MIRRSFAVFAVSLALLVTGCPAETPSAPAPAATTPATPTGTSAATPATGSGTHVSTGEWCAPHGVPEAVCTRCNASLIDSYKAKKDWCAEHTMPESQCIACNPEVEAKWKAMAPAAQ